MNSKYLRITCLITCILMSYQSFGQDKSLITQYIFNTQIFNPATVGDENQSNIFFTAEHEKPLDKNLNTFLLSFHDTLKSNKMGIGLNVFYTKHWIESTKSLTANYSYKFDFSENSNLRFGITTGINQNLELLTKVNLGDNDPDPAFEKDINYYYIPMGFGVYYEYKSLFLGVSNPDLFDININKPNDNVDWFSYYYFFGGVNFSLTEKISLKPNVLFFIHELKQPSTLDLSLYGNYLDNFLIGGSVCINESYSVTSHWKFANGLGIGLSYSSNLKPNTIRLNLDKYVFSLSYDL